MKIITLSGWGQPHDALEHAFPEAVHIDYAGSSSFIEAVESLRAQQNADVVIGWSMGGQIAAHAISEKIIAPKKLMLIAAPYQFMRTLHNQFGVGKSTIEKFRENYVRNAERTLNKAYELIAYNDIRAENIKPHLSRARARLQMHDWLRWYDHLSLYTPTGYVEEDFPHTLIVHGANDAVIGPEQAQAWSRLLPSSELHLWEGCGHAPHWHNEKALRAILDMAL